MKRFCLMLLATIWTSVEAVDIPSFTDQTISTGLSFTHQTDISLTYETQMMPPGVAVADINRDGYLDLIVHNGYGYNARLFINDGAGAYTDQALAWGIDTTNIDGSSVSAADIDANGYLDIYAGTIMSAPTGDPNHVYMNTGSAFVESGTSSGADVSTGTFGTTFGDTDLDGDLDLVVADWGGFDFGVSYNTLFVNDGSGVFSDNTLAAEVFTAPGKIWGFSPALVDLDGDRYPDLPVAGDFGTSQYHANDGDGTFTRLTGNGTTTDENGMGSTFGDYDNDGDLDWFVTSVFDDDGTTEGGWGATGNRLYRNDGNHQFTDITDTAGVRNGYWGWGTSFADFNHDGLLDLVMTNGFILPSGSNLDPTFETDPDRLWINTGDFITGPTFVEVSSQAGLVHTGDGKSLVAFDSDNDGDLDVLVTTNQGALIFFRNEYNPASDRWLEIDLLAPAGNAPDGIGATIDITVGGATYHQAVFSSPTFMGQAPLRAHFGFPAAPLVDQVVVTWPDGTTKTLSNVSPGQVLRVNSGDINQDDKVNAGDYLLVTRIILNLLTPTTAQQVRADINQDGDVTLADLLLLQAKVLGLSD